MDISSQIIKTALQEYDNQAGYTSYMRASAFGEYAEIASLREFCSTLSAGNRNLTQSELVVFISILIDTTSVGKQRHDELFTKLKALVGDDKLKAFARLKSEDKFADPISLIETREAEIKQAITRPDHKPN